jgi:hypothetical protein
VRFAKKKISLKQKDTTTSALYVAVNAVLIIGLAPESNAVSVDKVMYVLRV